MPRTQAKSPERATPSDAPRAASGASHTATESCAAWDAPLGAPAAAAIGVARSGDFAWVRGTYALGPADAPAETGAFLRVWRHDVAAWTLAVEVLSPARPPRPAPRDSTGGRG